MRCSAHVTSAHGAGHAAQPRAHAMLIHLPPPYFRGRWSGCTPLIMVHIAPDTRCAGAGR
jgi:hypothetical protein